MSAQAGRVSIVVPSRTGAIDPLRDQLRRQSLRGGELVVKQGIAPPARARNLGASEAAGEFLVFLDDDIRLGDDRLVEDLVSALQSLHEGSAVAVTWRLPPDASRLQRWQMRDAFGRDEAPDRAGLTPISWQSVGSACFAIRRRTFEALGGFDEQLRCGEDHDLWYRLTQRGGTLFLLADRWVYHYPPRTVTALLRKMFWYEQGNAQVARKHPEARYRLALRSRWHAAGYLALRTVALVPLMFIKVSYQHRRPVPAFRPVAALLSYVGAWVYCVSWFSAPREAS